MSIHLSETSSLHIRYADEICALYSASAKERGTGIAERQPAYVKTKIENGNAVIALDGDQLAGFCYIETWSHGRYVANSGLIIHPAYRKQGLARRIKERIIVLSRAKFPAARIFGITTSLAVMRINSKLGYQPVTFSELTQDDAFWEGCRKCSNFDILERNERHMCLCTAMLAPSQQEIDPTDSDPKADMRHDLSHLII